MPAVQEGVPHATACGKAGRFVGGGRGGEMGEAGPTKTLDPLPGVPQEEVAGGWEVPEPVVHPKGPEGRRGAPALCD